jgi:hypothetical protein
MLLKFLSFLHSSFVNNRHPSVKSADYMSDLCSQFTLTRSAANPAIRRNCSAICRVNRGSNPQLDWQLAANQPTGKHGRSSGPARKRSLNAVLRDSRKRFSRRRTAVCCFGHI